MKRVLLTSHKFFPEHRAGTEVLTLRTAQELQRRGHEVLVLAANPPDQDARARAGHAETNRYTYQGIPVVIIEEGLRLRNNDFFHEFDNPELVPFFNELLDDFKPDIVQINHCQNHSATIIDAAKSRGIPVMLYATDFWFICPIVQLILPDGSVCRGPAPDASNCANCYTPHLLPGSNEVAEALAARVPIAAPLIKAAKPALGAAYRELKKPSALAATRARPAYLRQQANKLDKILVPTALMRDLFVQNGIDADLIQICHFGIDLEELVKHTTKTPSTDFRIGYIGTFYNHKGVDLLINAFNNLSPQSAQHATLKLYGNQNQFPEYFAELQKLAQGNNNIEFCGTFDNALYGQVMESIDALVVPSRWYENTPLVMQSALATRTPLIVTDLGGMSELVKHEHNGLLFKLNDWHDLRDQLERVIGDRQFYEHLVGNIADERSVAAMVDDIESVYLQIGLEAT